MTPFLSNSLKALVKGTVTDQYFNILFSRCLSTMYFLLLLALHLGVMRKSFLFFREAPLIIVQARAEHIPFIFCFVRSILLLSYTVPLFARNVPWYLIFLKRTLVFPHLCFPLFLRIVYLRRHCYFSLLFLGTLHSDGSIFPFLTPLSQIILNCLSLMIAFLVFQQNHQRSSTFCLRSAREICFVNGGSLLNCF